MLFYFHLIIMNLISQFLFLEYALRLIVFISATFQRQRISRLEPKFLNFELHIGPVKVCCNLSTQISTYFIKIFLVISRDRNIDPFLQIF